MNFLRSFISPVTKRHIERRVLPTSASHLYQVIQNVNEYRNFLPLCKDSRILRTSPNGRSMEASLTVGLPLIASETYVSLVTLRPEEHIVEAKSIKSQKVDSLASQWQLRDITSAHTPQCQVDFWVEITVSDPFIIATLDQVLKQVAGRQVEAFAKRCYQLEHMENYHFLEEDHLIGLNRTVQGQA
jgi:coenzyme Q-binding protein COQ10